MNELRRLRDTDAFIDATGCDLADEALALEPATLWALKARVLSKAGAVPPRAGARRWWAVGVGVLVVGLFLGWAGARTPQTPVVALAPSTAAAETPPPGAEADLPTAAIVGIDPALARSPPLPVPNQPNRNLRPADLRAAAPALPAATPATSPSQPVSAAPQPSDRLTGDLAEQHAAFESAEDALAAGDGAVARQRYDAYLGRWPSGAFSPEARLGALWSELTQGHAEEAELMAGSLASDPAFAPRRDEILLLRAGALITLGRCQEALAIATQLPGVDARRIRRSCR